MLSSACFFQENSLQGCAYIDVDKGYELDGGREMVTLWGLLMQQFISAVYRVTDSFFTLKQ